MRVFSIVFVLVAVSALMGPLASATSVASVIVHVGDGVVDGRRIVSYDNVWLVQIHYLDGHVEDRGLSSDHVRVRDIQGQRCLTRIEGTTSVAPATQPLHGLFNSTFNVFDADTMAPLRGEYSDSTGQAQSRTFAGLDVTTVSRDNHGAETTEHVKLAAPVYDFDGGMTGLILAALPLNTGYVAQIPSMGDSGATTAQVHVEARERVEAGHLGRVEAWRVRVGPPEAGTLYWVRDTAPYVIKVAITRSDGVIATWTMI